MRLNRLLKPATIAVIGGGAWGRALIEQLDKLGFKGDVWPVHPRESHLGGRKTFAALNLLPQAPDACFIGVNRLATIDIVRQLAKLGTGGAVCFASGFAEAEAEDKDAGDLQCQLLDAAGDMPILGPNCYGYLNLVDRTALWPDQHGAIPVQSGVAIITQSSNIAINMSMQQRGLPIAYVLTVGNGAQISMAYLAEQILDDPRVTALGLHIEGFGDLPAFEAMARKAHSLGKPIIAIKVGRSSQAQEATQSHTASLAGSDAGAGALMRRLGIARLDSPPAFIETLKLIHLFGTLPSARIGSVSCSGGEASLMADLGQKHELEFPALNARQSQALRTALGPLVALANPLDYHTYIWGDEDKVAAMIAGMVDPDLAITLIVLDFPRADRCDDKAWEHVINAAQRVQNQTGAKIGILASMPETMPEGWAQRCLAANLLPLGGIDEAMTAIKAAAWLGQAMPEIQDLRVPGALHQAPQLVDEGEVKAALSTYGLDTPRSAKASSGDQIEQQAQELRFPLVMKATGLAHKSDAGGVVLGLENIHDLRVAYAKMPSQDVLIEEMIEGAIAELLVGIRRDPAHGFVLTLGAGGVLTELLSDVISLLLPVSEAQVHKALLELNIYKLLNGYRGKPAANLDAIVKSVMAVQAFALDNHNHLSELEINPLLCGTKRAVAVDALYYRSL